MLIFYCLQDIIILIIVFSKALILVDVSIFLDF